MTATKKTTPHVMPLGRLRSLLVVAVVVGLAACGQDDGPIAPVAMQDAANPATVTINGVELLLAPSSGAETARFGKKAGGGKSTGGGKGRCSTYDRRLINNNGGILQVCGAQLEVHSGSFPRTEHLWMDTGDRRDDGLWSYEFGPSGTTFAPTPATLTIQVKAKDLKRLGIDPNQLSIAFVSGPGHSDWEVVGVDYDWDTQTISAPIQHFSRYALCIE